jgi:hypothetical protein
LLQDEFGFPKLTGDARAAAIGQLSPMIKGS